MHEISWLVVVIYSIPECFLVVWLGLQVINVKPSLLKLAVLSIIYGPFVYIVRKLPLPYGFHTLILTMLIVGMAVMILNVSVKKSILGIFIGVIVTLSLETLTLSIYTLISKVSLTEIIKDPYLSIIVSMPKLITMALIGLYLKRKKKCLFNLSGSA
ncbi:hypothetical protein [Desulfotomaculum sp. 1211_IL3151]|uniref:hypothetical protein n=1 Tax=Desulfotomaculum sp. 1211_IL3151 TaxID=3084055 RepID=UPI002FDAEF2F